MWGIRKDENRVKKSFLFLQLIWFLIICASIFINHRYSQRELENIAIARAHAVVDRDLAYRNWTTTQGGDYPESVDLAPLELNPVRTARSGIDSGNGSFIRNNLVYLLPPFHEGFSEDEGSITRITSLQPLRQENIPDSWEEKVLKTFKKGKAESLLFVLGNNEPHLRYMKVLVAEAPCLICHGRQGYREGDVLGAISLNLSLADLLAGHEKTTRTLFFLHLPIYLVGTLLLFRGQGLLSRRARERDLAIAALEASEEKFRTLADFTYAWEYWLDAHGELAYVSPSVERITGYSAQELMRKPELLFALESGDDKGKFHDHLRNERGLTICEFDFRLLTRNGEERWLHHVCRSMHDADGNLLGRRASNYDITEQKKAELEKEQSIGELRAALDKVKLLSGFLPICANCKKIRDDKGYWNQIEAYVSEHSDAVFSHGICPECSKKLYPEFRDDEIL